VNRAAQAVVLLLVGGAILRASLTDVYLRYVKDGLRPFLIAAGAVLIAAAVATLWYDLRPARPAGAGESAAGESAGDHDDDGHGHAHREPRVAWLLVLPVLALLLVAPPALGSYAAGRSGTALPEVSEFPALPAGDPVTVGLLDYATRAVYDDGRSLAGRRVRLTGFVLIGPDGSTSLARMTLNCCAADAQPIKVGLTGNVPSGLAPDTWLEVIGTYTDRAGRDEVNGAPIPYVEVIEAHPVAPPANQYDA
jgi:uncharacterized repeat protein (TIGR03943 family)